MSEGVFDDIAAIHVLHNLREGDVVWVVLNADVDDMDVEAVQRVLQTVIEEDVSLIVTKQGFVEGLRRLSLTDLLQFQGEIESAINALAEYQPADQDV